MEKTKNNAKLAVNITSQFATSMVVETIIDTVKDWATFSSKQKKNVILYGGLLIVSVSLLAFATYKFSKIPAGL